MFLNQCRDWGIELEVHAGEAEMVRPSREYGIWHGMVEYSHAVMEEIRVAAVNGFNSFGHGGLEIGGVLYGEKRGDVVRVLAAAELPCEHALGPGFVLSEKDQPAFRESMKAPAGMRTVGWYCSHTRSSVALNANDCSIMERFFGERGSIALIVKPTRFGPVEATFHVQGCAEAGPHFSVLVAWAEEQVETIVEEQCEDSAPLPSRLNEVVLDELKPSRLHVPALVRWAAMGVLLAAIGAWYISTRPAPRAAPRPDKVGLQAYHIADKQVRIEWDRQSGALRGVAAGTLEIVDGASKYSLPLSAEQLRSSSLTYGRQTEAISVRLRLANGVEESVQVVAPLAPAPPIETPTPMPTPTPAVVQAASMPPAEPPQADRRAPLRQFVLGEREPQTPRNVSLPDAPPTATPTLALVPKLPLPLPMPPVSVAPPVAPVSHKPRSGRMIWTGSLGRRGVVEFEGSTATIGSLSGGLPGTAAKLSVLPAEFARDVLVVYVNEASRHNKTEAPGPLTGWNRLHFVWDPERVKELSVLEMPNANNQFARLALRNDAKACSVIVVEWSTQ